MILSRNKLTNLCPFGSVSPTISDFLTINAKELPLRRDQDHVYTRKGFKNFFLGISVFNHVS